MAAAVANGGWLVQPHFVERVADEPPIDYPRTRVEGLEGPTLAFLRRAMVGVVEHPDGTAHWTRLANITVAGKTGTAQNPHGEHHSWYMAYAPAEDPEIALAILVENAGHGSEVAAPIARDFIAEYYRPGRIIEGPPPQVGSAAPRPEDPREAAPRGGGQP
jgi:cell division protein FtsI/penicillin-binding protein 2